MTTIAYKDGILAADTLFSCMGTVAGYGPKIERTPSGRLVGASGNATYIRRLLKWAKTEKGDPPLLKSTENGMGLIVELDGTVTELNEDGSYSLSMPFHASGSGTVLAMGVMAQGGTAEEAIRIAIRYDLHTGGDVMTLQLSQPASKPKGKRRSPPASKQ